MSIWSGFGVLIGILPETILPKISRTGGEASAPAACLAPHNLRAYCGCGTCFVEASPARLAAFCKLGFGHHAQGWQKLMDGAPYKAMDYILMVVPVDVAGGGHLAPRDVGVARLGFGR